MIDIDHADAVVLVALAGFHEARRADLEHRPWPGTLIDLTPAQREVVTDHAKQLAGCIRGGHLTISSRSVIYTADASAGQLIILDWHDGNPNSVDIAELEPWLTEPLAFVRLPFGQEVPVQGIDYPSGDAS